MIYFVFVDMISLPKPSLSQNLIYEDRRDVKQVVSHVIAQDATINLVANTIHLKRGHQLYSYRLTCLTSDRSVRSEAISIQTMNVNFLQLLL